MLQGVSLQLKQGEVLALTGPSGEGKSTLASLITRLYEPHSGDIFLDDVPIATLNPSWLRRQVRAHAEGSGWKMPLKLRATMTFAMTLFGLSRN